MRQKRKHKSQLRKRINKALLKFHDLYFGITPKETYETETKN